MDKKVENKQFPMLNVRMQEHWALNVLEVAGFA